MDEDTLRLRRRLVLVLGDGRIDVRNVGRATPLEVEVRMDAAYAEVGVKRTKWARGAT